MFSRPELMQLHRQLKSTTTLSVYLSDAADDPAQRGNGRRALAHRLSHLRDALGESSHSDHEALGRAIEHAERQVQAIPVTESFKGWACFVTEQGVQHSAMLPVVVPTEAVWGDGLWLSPYIHGLDHQRSAIVAIADSRLASMFRYRDGALVELVTLETEVPVGSVSHMGAPPQMGFHTGTRGGTGADAADRVRQVQSARLASEAAEYLHTAAHLEEIIFVGGIPAMAHAIVSLIHERWHAQVLAGLDVHATPSEIAARVETALEVSRAEQDQAVLHDLTEGALGAARAAFGVTATLAALRLGAVSRLILTEAFAQRDRVTSEAVVQLACDRDAQIIYVAGVAASQLEERGAGIGARLRFPIPQAVV
jgi:hypothetical protein